MITTKKSSINFSDRCYWFFRNLLAFILLIIISPFYWIWKIIYSTSGAVRILFITDGSEIISFCNEWDWIEGDV